MANKDLLGVGGDLPAWHDPVHLLVADGTFPTDLPYLLADGRSLLAPLPIVATNEDTYTASDGSLQPSWGAPAPDMPPLSRDEPPNGVTNQGVPVTYNGAYVTNG